MTKKDAKISEFEIINKFLRPLSLGESGAFQFTDDAAILPQIGNNEQYVVTKDIIAINVHALDTDPPSTLGRKALRVNLSDLAAMGAEPVAFFMGLIINPRIDEVFLCNFASGLMIDVKKYNIPLLGGDIICDNSSFSISITAVGKTTDNLVLRSNGAQKGELLWVSGSIGDSALGLLSSKKEITYELTKGNIAHLVNRYQIPQPRIALGQELLNIASACTDLSDGLLADIKKLCKNSGLGCTINGSQLPLSNPAKLLLSSDVKFLETIVTGGDDYELAFSSRKENTEKLQELAKKLRVPISCIGEFTSGPEIRFYNDNGKEMNFLTDGYEHN
ncbi:MAG: thiamine-phosphate kinase [Rhodospirillaceae bacterium]|nr:thiamine-phosphate kinase [Rhodospirillaceae bacterium]